MAAGSTAATAGRDLVRGSGVSVDAGSISLLSSGQKLSSYI